MPLKHRTETRLVIVLGLVMVLAGFVMAALPPIPTGLLPWGLAFIVTLAYPLFLYPLFRRDRADYVFRVLHWVPAGMLIAWLLLQVLLRFWPAVLPVFAWYTWGWGFVPVALGVLALVNYCLDVVRQRVPRVPVLLLIWVLFAFGALRGSGVGESTQRWLASVFERNPAVVSGTGSAVSAGSSVTTSARLSSSKPSSIPSSSSSSAKMVAQVRSTVSRASAGTVASGASTSAASSEELSFWEWIIGSGEDEDSVSSAPTSGSNRSASLRSVSSSPSQLPDSGFGWSEVALTLAALYCAALHRKTKARLA